MADFGLDDLITCYKSGIFPMSDHREDETLFLVDPPMRGILPLDSFHVSSRLGRTIRHTPLEVRIDTAFTQMIELCAQSAEDRPNTWISHPIQSLYQALFGRGLAHSVEVWDADQLVGGLYGVAIGGAFFGESMASRVTDASKIALVHLVARLKSGQFSLLDCQFQTDHLKQFGTIETPRALYKKRLKKALEIKADFHALPRQISGIEAMAIIRA